MSNVQLHAPFRADYVGSFLRPEELKEARNQFAAGQISASALKEVEDRLITDLIRKQKAVGLQSITDGEFRRAYWHLDFMWGLQGVEHIELEHGYQFVGEEKFKLGNVDYTEFTVVIILNLTGRVVGVVVDSVSDVIMLTAAQIRPAPDFSGTFDTKYIVGLATLEERMVIVTDIEMLMNSADMELIEAVAA